MPVITASEAGTTARSCHLILGQIDAQRFEARRLMVRQRSACGNRHERRIVTSSPVSAIFRHAALASIRKLSRLVHINRNFVLYTVRDATPAYFEPGGGAGMG